MVAIVKHSQLVGEILDHTGAVTTMSRINGGRSAPHSRPGPRPVDGPQRPHDQQDKQNVVPAEREQLMTSVPSWTSNSRNVS